MRPPAHARTSRLTADALAAVQSWEQLWQTPGLAERISITVSTRLRTTLARCLPAHGRVVLSDTLLGGSKARLREVLCHEVAHVAVYRRHGRTVSPHGAEWAQLVRLAGYTPATRTASRRLGDVEWWTRPAQHQVVHTCPVCHTRRFARRAVSRWRCAECVAAGLSGELVVTRAPIPR